MRAARFLGELLWKNSVGCYELIALETLLLEKYSALFAAQNAKVEVQVDYLHVLTKAYDTGGHTRVVERLIASQALCNSAVLVTEKIEPKTAKKLALAKAGLTVLAAMPSSEANVDALLSAFASAKNVILHIHPNDIESVFAAALAKKFFGTKIFLYNHADHVFSYGYSMADRVLELSYFGWALRPQRRTLERSSFVGIPLNLSTNAQSQTETKPRQAYLASSGSPYKFKPSQGYSFPIFASEFCQRCDLPMVLIGPRRGRDWWWWRSAISAKGKIRFTGKMGHAEYLDYLSSASAYIDSFPMTGGTSFSEIFCLGVPCFGVLTGAHGYSPADQLKSANLSTLMTDVLHFVKEGETEQKKFAHILPETVTTHSSESVAQRILDASNPDSPLAPPPWANPIAVDTHFYEKIWDAQKMPTVPVHSRPNMKIAVGFIWFWIKTKLQTSART